MQWFDAWIDIGIGVVVLLLQPRWLQWASSRIFHTSFNEFLDNAGAVVPYTRVPEFWMDLGPTVFGVVLILDGLLMCARKRWAIMAALVLIAVSTVFNAGYLVFSYRDSGLAVWSLVATIMGVYLGVHQWQMIAARPRAAFDGEATQ